MMPTNAQVNAVKLPHYDAALSLTARLYKWARAGFPGATLSDLAQIASNDTPAELLRAIRLRAEKRAKEMLRGGI
jgi:hypothetical protein